ncbi:MAG: phospholipase D family protein [Desulfovibrio sp.]|nr:phospholipase D family protein [Desulfovibrio sp.]
MRTVRFRRIPRPRAFLQALAVFLCLCMAGCLASGRKYNVAFSPKGDSLDLVLSAVSAAEQSILVAAYSFTSKPVAQALLEASKRGVSVRVVADKKSNSGRYTAVTFLANRGVPVRLNGHYAIHHHKFMVIDGRHVQTGSFNYSAAAVNKNAENVLLIRDAPELAGRYAAEWQRLWEEGVPLEARY